MTPSPEIELDANQALFAARMLELAVHHEGPWTFKWGEIEIPAERIVNEDGVTFAGRFPDVCYLRRPEGSLLLMCEGMVAGMRRPEDFEHPGDTAFAVTWKVLTRHDRVPQ